MIELMENEIDVADAYRRLDDPACGAAVVFVGRVRDHHEGRGVTHIHYTAYADMVRTEGMRILEEARAQFSIRQSLIIHRVGPHVIGDISVVVGVASVHRADSFAAAEWIMNEVKKRLPVWKEEFYTEGDRAWPHNTTPDAP